MIIPRNAHKSTIGGIILSGAIPVYIQPEINDKLGKQWVFRKKA
ncbi:hypothetical protein I6N90_13710 [Paenibacillus sp. GSMTC-2017]|nr:hypothetical protein [Paenibacillus sp. GSMTC-2017]